VVAVRITVISHWITVIPDRRLRGRDSGYTAELAAVRLSGWDCGDAALGPVELPSIGAIEVARDR
jgi:hypothetical protein